MDTLIINDQMIEEIAKWALDTGYIYFNGACHKYDVRIILDNTEYELFPGQVYSKDHLIKIFRGKTIVQIRESLLHAKNLSYNKFYDDPLDKLFDKFMMHAEITYLRNIVIEQSNRINDLTDKNNILMDVIALNGL